METSGHSLDGIKVLEVEENKRKEDRKRRNRESAAKCRQKLKDKLVSAQRLVAVEEYRNKALKNEISLVDIEYKKIGVILKQHSNHCNLPNGHNSSLVLNTGINNGYNGVTAENKSSTDVNNNTTNASNMYRKDI